MKGTANIWRLSKNLPLWRRGLDKSEALSLSRPALRYNPNLLSRIFRRLGQRQCRSFQSAVIKWRASEAETPPFVLPTFQPDAPLWL